MAGGAQTWKTETLRRHESTGHVEDRRGGWRSDHHSFASLWSVTSERRLARPSPALSRITRAPGWRLRVGGSRAVASHADVCRHRLLPCIETNSAEQNQTGGV